jgi:hypothetical protein
LDANIELANTKKLVSLNFLMQNQSYFSSLTSFTAKIKPINASTSVSSDIKVSISFQKLLFNEKDCQILRLRDITANKKLQKVQTENKMLSLLTASVSHELLNPIKCIETFAKELFTLITSS